MRTSLSSTWCAFLVVVFAVSTTGCDNKPSENSDKQASAQQPAEQRGAALKPTEATDEKETTKVVEQKQYAPEILDLDFEPSKFVKCGQQIEICAQARDRNGDTVQFTWKQQAGEEPLESFAVSDSIQTGSRAEECVTFKPDRGFNQIQLIASEDAQGGRADSISFPLHVAEGNCS